MGATRITVGWLHPGDVAGCFIESLSHTLLRDRRMARINTTFSLQSGPRIVESRNFIVRYFLKDTRDDWLLMIDADMAWDFDAFETLVKHADADDVPIIGGLCFAGGQTWVDGSTSMFPTLYSFKEEGKEAEKVLDYERDALVRVDATGAAFLMVHRRVFEQMRKATGTMPGGEPNPHPWFAELYYHGRQVGEDIGFFMRCQALGIPVHVHTGAKVKHRKFMYLDEKMFDEVTSGRIAS